jgi:hypothetical protein
VVAAGIERWLAVAVGENEEEGANGNGQEVLVAIEADELGSL